MSARFLHSEATVTLIVISILFLLNFGLLVLVSVIVVSVSGSCVYQLLLYCLPLIFCVISSTFINWNSSLGKGCPLSPICLFMSVWAHGFSPPMVYSLLLLLFCCSYCSSFVHRTSFGLAPVSSEHAPFFWNISLFSCTTNCSSLVFAPPQLWKQLLWRGVPLPLPKRVGFAPRAQLRPLGVLAVTVE